MAKFPLSPGILGFMCSLSRVALRQRKGLGPEWNSRSTQSINLSPREMAVKQKMCLGVAYTSSSGFCCTGLSEWPSTWAVLRGENRLLSLYLNPKLGRWSEPGREDQEPSGVLAMVYILICKTTRGAHTHVNIHWAVLFRLVKFTPFIMCILHCNEK